MFTKSLFGSALSLMAASLCDQDIAPTQFKTLCETSPLNTVVVRAPTQILGKRPVVTEVNAACRVNFLGGSILNLTESTLKSTAGGITIGLGTNGNVSASIDGYRQRSGFSKYGPKLVLLSAPGEGVIVAYPGSNYASAWGTSFSTPLVAGAAALLVQRNPDWTPRQIEAELLRRAVIRWVVLS